jgi:hypothetical protein
LNQCKAAARVSGVQKKVNRESCRVILFFRSEYRTFFTGGFAKSNRAPPLTGIGVL